MFNQDIQLKTVEKVTGFILPVGNGAVGKSTLALVMDSDRADFPEIKKSLNLEFGYVKDFVEVDQTGYQIMQQFLIPPGQKETEGIDDKHSFENIIDTYSFLFRRIDVILLIYKMNELETFNDLEYWINQALPLCSPSTHFILVGTHLDKEISREVSGTMIQNGLSFLSQTVVETMPDWTGRCTACEVSTLTGENLQQLRNTISLAILQSRKFINR
jgi:GTPase SAR1 family protein